MKGRWALAIIVVMTMFCPMLPVGLSGNVQALDVQNHMVGSSGSSLTLDDAVLHLEGVNDQTVVPFQLYPYPTYHYRYSNHLFSSATGGYTSDVTTILNSDNMTDFWWQYFFLVQSLGLNCVRLGGFNGWGFNWLYHTYHTDRALFDSVMDPMFEMAERNRVYLVFDFGSGGDDCSFDVTTHVYGLNATLANPLAGSCYRVGSACYDEWVSFMGTVMTHYQDETSLAMWEANNEPDVDGMLASYWSHFANPKEAYRSWAENLTRDLNAVDHHHLLTIGAAVGGLMFSMNEDTKLANANDADVCQSHVYGEALIGHGYGSAYGEEENESGYAAERAEAAVIGKPVFFGEGGYASVSPPWVIRYWPFLHNVSAKYDINLCWLNLLDYPGYPISQERLANVPDCPTGSISIDVAQEGDYIYEWSGSPAVATITRYAGAGGAIAIPSTLGGHSTVAIGNQAFGSCASLTSVTIPSSITSIGVGAFCYCSALASLSIGSGVSFIEGSAFSYCTSLTSLTIPSNVISIGDRAYQSCTSLTAVVIPSSVTSIGDRAFQSCASLTTIDVGAGNPNYAIVDGILYNKAMTTLIQCPGGKIEAHAIPGSVTSIASNAFASCASLSSLAFPSSLTSIGSYAFQSCRSLTALNIPNGVTSIGEGAFLGCAALASVSIGSGTAAIGDGAYAYCTGLTSVTIPNSVTYIGGNAFASCTSMTSIEVNLGNANYASLDGVLYNKALTTLVQCPGGKAGAFTVPSGVTSIGREAFSSCDSLISVAIPDSVSSIGYYAFSSCSSLITVTIPNGIASVGYYWFASCPSLTSVNIPSGAIQIMDGAYSGCSALTSVALPDSVASIGNHAFRSCTSLTSINVGAANPSFASVDGILYNKAMTTLIQCPGGKAGALSIPSSVKDIGSLAFAHCTSLSSVTIPSGVRSIGYDAFYSCDSLTAMNVDAANPGYTSVDGVLYDKTTAALIQCPGGRAGEFTIPDGVTSIGDHAFQFCTSLTSLDVPESVSSIGGLAFHYCTSLTSITFQGPVAPNVGHGWLLGANSGARGHALAISDFPPPGSVFNGLIMGAVSADPEGDYIYSVGGTPTVATITDYIGPGGAIVIPAMLGGYATAAIDDDAFAWQDTLTSVVIPSSVKTIGYSAFYYCTSLTNVTIGGGVTNISKNAFYACSILTSITFQGLVAPTMVGDDWIANTDVGIKGHAYAASNFPAPGGIFHGLTMGAALLAPVAPGAPTGLTALGGAGFVLLIWTAPTDAGDPPLTRYDVYRGTSSGVYGSPICNVSVGTLTYNDTMAIPGIPYFYVVKAVNLAGSSPASNQATGTALPTVPSAPQNVAASAGAGNVSLNWEAPASNGGSSITNYKIYRSTSSGGETLLATIGNALGYTDNGLTNGQPYYYQVSAVNGIGEGARSDEVAATPASVPTAPRGLQAVAGNSIIELNWTTPDYAGPGTLTYHLFRGSSEIWTGTAPAHDDVSVTNGIAYSYQVAASNSLGWGENCSPVLATPFGPPSAPRGLTTVPGNELIDLNWTAPVYRGPGTTIYHLFRDGAEIWSGTAVAHRDAPLTKGVEHSYTVAANNSIGWGQNSSVVRSAALGVPDAPRDLAAAVGDGWIALDWAAPSYVGPGTLTYHLLRNASEIWSGVATSYTDLAVVNGVNYSYSAVANNSIGWSASSAEVQATPQAGETMPTWPRDLTAMPGEQRVDLNWTEPSYLGPGTITYHLFRDSIEIWSGIVISYLDSPLTKGVEYSYTVAAQNSIGWGPNCTAVLAIPFGVPDAPWNLSAIAGDGQVSLSWNAVNYSGPGTLLYHLFRDDILIWSGSEASFTDTDVANGFSYAYNVAASNSVGWSENSSIALAAPIGPPSEPIGLTATAGDEQVDLTWDAPAYWGPGGIIYHLFRDDLQIWSGGVNYYNDSSLTNGMTYNYTVSASNSIGWGLNSTEVPASPFGPPSAPLNLVAVPGHDNVTLNWTAPVYAGPGILTYHLFRDDMMIWSGSEIAFIDTGLTGGRNYSYRVSANNSVGWGPNSTLVEVAPIALVLPSMPENFQVTAGDGSVNISWGAPLASGTSPITGYKIYRGTNSSSMTLLTTVTSGNIYQDIAVTNGQKYYYKVYASSSVGDGVSTEVLNATPQAPIVPAAPGDSTMIFVAIGAAVIGVAAAVFFLRKRR